jgi:hypothetical protein
MRVLPSILRTDVGMTAIDIIRRVREGSRIRWTDSSMRFHLSCISKNASGPIRRKRGRNGRLMQGYYLAPEYERRWSPDAQHLAFQVLRSTGSLLRALSADSTNSPTYWAEVARLSEELQGQMEAVHREIGEFREVAQ